jgi:hypothetical protein
MTNSDMKSLFWDLGNSTTTTPIHTTFKHMLPLMNFEQHVTPRFTTSFSTKFQLQTTDKISHNNYLPASSLRTSLMAKKLHVKNALYAKM